MVIDIILVIVAVYGFYVGYTRGIIKTIFSVLAIAVGIIAALRFSPAVTDFLKQMFNETSPLMFVAGLILTFALTMMFLKLLGRGFEGLLEAANINVINQTLGGAFMASVLILIYSGILWFVLQASFRNLDEVTADSQTYPFLKEYPEQVWKVAGKMKPLVQDFWDYTIDIMDEVQTMTEKSEGDTQVYDIPEEEFDARRN
ncbi:MAG: CvpA family protein [Haliscomenobacter sp.]|nr:CvpA family protein [Haliscomenobacter sp.]MBK8878301.1 CvpA family protein [Haliscomenobacter sp.]